MPEPEGEKWILAPREKLILIRAYRCGEPSDPVSEPPMTGAWFVIERYPQGFDPTPQEIFGNPSGSDLVDSSYALVGSTLYVFGGRDTSSRIYDTVRCINILDPTNVWKTCESLPFPCDRASVAVAGNLIYLYTYPPKGESTPRCCVFDTITQERYEIKPPEGLSPDNRFFVTIEHCSGACFVLVPLYNWTDLHIHHPYLNDWIPRLKLPAVDGVPEPRSSLYVLHHAALNGVLYLSYTGLFDGKQQTLLCVFDVSVSGSKCLLKIYLPEDINPSDASKMFLVALDDMELAYLWYLPLEGHKMKVFLAIIKVFYCDPTYSVQEFELDADRISCCLPMVYMNPSRRDREISEMVQFLQENECPQSDDDTSLLSVSDLQDLLSVSDLRDLHEKKNMMEAEALKGTFKNDPRLLTESSSSQYQQPSIPSC